MIAEFISPNDARWRQLLDRAPHDGYHLPNYAHVAGLYERSEPVAFYAEENGEGLLMPLLVRELPPGLGAPRDWRDAVSPYGYSGPIATAGTRLETLRCAFTRFRQVARDHEIVSAFVRPHPLRSVPFAVLREFGTVVSHGPIIYIDLSKTLEQLWSETRVNHRRNIARLMRLGYTAEIDDWSADSAFRMLYRMTMRRRSAAPPYYFSDAYFDRLREKLPDHLHLCIVRAPTGDVAAGGLFISADGMVEYHLGGTADEYLPHAPSKLMFDFVWRWAKVRGASILNLGGGIGGTTSSLQEFKRGFSRSQADLFTARFIFDEDRYTRLTAMRRVLGPIDEGPDAFFPTYRQASDFGVVS